jgi:hypothetical protein
MTEIARSPRAMTALWYGFAVGPAAWAAHLMGQAAFVRYACNDPGWHWALHLMTAVTAVPTVVGLVICLGIARRVTEGEDAGTPPGRTRFLALLAAFTAAISLALILLEGSYVLFISSCA